MPLRDVRKWARYVKRSLTGTVTRSVERKSRHAELKPWQRQKIWSELRRFYESEGKSKRRGVSIAAAILADTAIKQLGLNKKLSPQKLRQLKKLGSESVKASFEAARIKYRSGRAISDQYRTKMASELLREAKKIIVDKKTAENFFLQLEQAKRIYTRFVSQEK